MLNNREDIKVKEFTMSKLKKEKGSLTLEAAIVMPIFFLLMLFMYGILMIFSGQELISHALLQSSESLSLDSYATEIIGGTGLDNAKSAVNSLYQTIVSTDTQHKQYFSSTEKWYEGEVESEAKMRFIGYFSGGDEEKAESLLQIVGVENGLNGLDFSESYIDENNDLHISVKYTQRFIFDMGGNLTFQQSMGAVAHMWE